MKNEEMMNAEYFHRSAAVPVTIVSAVSMKTIWKRNITMTPTSYVGPLEHHALLAEQAPRFAEDVNGEFRTERRRTPRLETAPTPPS